MKACSHVYILITLIPDISSFMAFTLLSVSRADLSLYYVGDSLVWALIQ